MEVTPNGKVTDFEVGVFCGKYKTEVPAGYFEHLNESRGKKRKMAEQAAGPQTAVGNSGPVNVAKRTLADGAILEDRTVEDVNGEDDKNAGMANPNNRQDIRYVSSVLGLGDSANSCFSILHNWANEPAPQ
jgi:amidophosphoribosyltransferase